MSDDAQLQAAVLDALSQALEQLNLQQAIENSLQSYQQEQAEQLKQKLDEAIRSWTGNCRSEAEKIINDVPPHGEA